MTTYEKETTYDYLENAEVGDFVEYDGRVVEVTDMVGGRYLFIENGYVSGQADQTHYAIQFLCNGGYVKERYAGTAKIH